MSHLDRLRDRLRPWGWVAVGPLDDVMELNAISLAAFHHNAHRLRSAARAELWKALQRLIEQMPQDDMIRIVKTPEDFDRVHGPRFLFAIDTGRGWQVRQKENPFA